jgi:hypothetical protein
MPWSLVSPEIYKANSLIRLKPPLNSLSLPLEVIGLSVGQCRKISKENFFIHLRITQERGSDFAATVCTVSLYMFTLDSAMKNNILNSNESTN